MAACDRSSVVLFALDVFRDEQELTVITGVRHPEFKKGVSIPTLIIVIWLNTYFTLATSSGASHHVRELNQARTATAVNKQLNFTVKNEPHTTNYIYCIFEAYFMIKSL